jgi:hypothetical protein
MKIGDIVEYSRTVQEEQDNDQLFEMANVTSRYHGIKNVVIWVGLATKQHGLRIKVSKVPNKMDVDNCFVIMMPSLDYDPRQVPEWIDRRTMAKIVAWIKLNQKLLHDYETGLIDDTGLFLEKISKV